MKFLAIFVLIFSFFKDSIANQFNHVNSSSLEIVPRKIIKIGQNFFFGIKINLNKGWKTYWKNPGDAGAPIELDWLNNEDIESFEILYPFPKKFEDNQITTIGYENEVIFPIKIKLKNDKNVLKSNLKINYLVCKDICIPIETKKNINFDFSDFVDSIYDTQIYSYFQKVPQVALGEFKVVSKNISKENLILRIRSKNITNNLKAFIYSADNEFKIESIKNEKDLIIEVSSDNKIVDSKDGFFLALSNGNYFEEIFVGLENLNSKNNGIYYFLFLAFLGGVILNFMPCVLPVLSLKLYSFIKLRNEKKPEILKFSVSTILGIFFSFLILSILIFILKIVGVNIGWGFQFQNTYFLISITLIVFLFSLNLLGLFEIIFPQFLLNKINSKINNSSFLGHFLSGSFATLLATPCSAPFLGTAIGFSVMASNEMIFLIFLFISLGFSFPYIIFLIAPGLISLFPKPGKWMLNVKYIMGVLLILSFSWLLTLLKVNILFIFSFSSLVIIISLLIERNKFKYVVSFLFLIIFFSFIQKDLKKDDVDKWEKFDVELLNFYLEKDYLILIDFTATWCVTCQINKITTLDSKELREYFAENNVKTLRGDWSKKDTIILDFILSYDRFGIPVNIVFGPKNKNGKLLPEILTKDIVIKEINLVK